MLVEGGKVVSVFRLSEFQRMQTELAGYSFAPLTAQPAFYWVLNFAALRRNSGNDYNPIWGCKMSVNRERGCFGRPKRNNLERR